MKKSFFEAPTPCGPCNVAYTDWGDTNNPNVIVCVHGLTRNSRDFDLLAEALSADYRVLCIDIPGRGKSDWLSNPANYTYETYCSIMSALVTYIRTPRINWVGTSMGGIIGMMVAAMPNSPIQKMVINDIGPFIPKSALKRIGTYLALDFHFDKQSQIEPHLREIHAPFGPLTDDQWAHMAKHGSRQDDQGQWRLSYDPDILVPFKDTMGDDIAFWEVWDAIKCQKLLIRGQDSDLLLNETAKEMTTRGSKTELIEFAGIGHAPSLMAPDQILAIQRWFS